MDKITSGIIDKLSLIGFFNVILSGGIILYGSSPLINEYAPGLLYVRLGVEEDFEKVVVIILLCFVIGSILQGFQRLLFKNVKSKIVTKCLSDMVQADDEVLKKGVLSNKYQREGVMKMAEKLFEDKNLGPFDPKDASMAGYFFNYCENSNSIKGYSGRASRSSEAANFYEQLAVAFYALAIIGVLATVFGTSNVLLYSIGFFALGSVLTGMAYNSRMNWAKAVLSTYEVVTDIENARRRMIRKTMVK